MVRRLALATALALAACSAPAAGRPQVAPAFALPDLAGGKASLASLHGKVVVLDFWATWCAPCLAEIPDYAAFFRKNQARGVEVVGVVLDSGEAAEILDFVREQKIPYRQLLGDDAVADAYEADALPTTLVIDRRGHITRRLVGAVPDKFDTLQKEVDAALGAR